MMSQRSSTRPSEDEITNSTARRLSRKGKDNRRISLELPDRFKDADDIDKDVSAPPKGQENFGPNQSLFSMIARTTSRADLQTHMEERESSEEESGVAQSTLDVRSRDSRHAITTERGSASVFLQKHRRRISDTKLLRALPRLKTRRDARPLTTHNDEPSAEDADAQDHMMSSSQFLPPKPAAGVPKQTEIPKLKKELESRARDAAEDSGEVAEPLSQIKRTRTDSDMQMSTKSLAERLKDIFEFEEVEEVIAQYNSWLIQSVLLQGLLYITQKHLCFYAYVPRKETARTGFLAKRGRSKFNRYWFQLKGDVLAYFNDSSEIYFPRNRINLSHAQRAYVVETKNKDKGATEFKIESGDKTYLFKADSATSANDWVRAIQKVIFRSHNDGSSVKISIPLQNVWEIEENPLMGFTDTIKIRVIDNDETYAMDEYFFSFWQSAEEVLRILRILTADEEPSEEGRSNTASPRVSTSVRPKHLRGTESPLSPDGAQHYQENVRATLSPVPPTDIRGGSPRPSMDSRSSSFDARRRSLETSRAFKKALNDRGRRSFSGTRSTSQSNAHKSPLSPKPHDSSPSIDTSFDQYTESSAAIQSLDETNASASQILTRTDVFRNPTIQRSTSGIDIDSEKLRQSQDTARFTGDEQSRRRSRVSKAPKYNADATQDDDDDSDVQNSRLRQSESGSALRNIVQAGQYPIQKASSLLEKFQTRSKRMSKMLSTETMGYYEKVSGMWAGGRRHYNVAEGLAPDDMVDGSGPEDLDIVRDIKRFREHFALPETEELQSVFFGSLQRVIPLYGKIYISDRHFCFRSMVPTRGTKLILPLKDIETAVKEKGFRLQFHGLVITIRGHEELFFEFNNAGLRNECTITLLRLIENVRDLEASHVLTEDELRSEQQSTAERDLLQSARAQKSESAPPLISSDTDPIPLIFDDPLASVIDFKPKESLNITCLTIGSRGDVQPYIAFCQGLLREGHKPKIATHAEFESGIREHGIDFAPVAGDPAELMRLCIEKGMFTLDFIREAHGTFRGWIDDLLQSSWEACQGSDVIIESPSAMAGLHIAEALRIPYYRAFGMTWTRTRTYPQAFATPTRKMGGYYNSMSYTLFNSIFWKGIGGQVNRWRRETLKLPGTSMPRMQAESRPFLYFVSPHVLPPPIDWPDWIQVTGYWFLDVKDDWKPPADLVAFIAKARADNKKIVYIGFGSIIVDDPASMTQTVVESVLKADVRCILSKGWSNRAKESNGQPLTQTKEPPLPADIFQIKEAPHDWLFKQVDAAVHHGGSGTTGASLRAGLPTIIKPFFGDQYFYGQRVEDLGVGLCLPKLNVHFLGKALWLAANEHRMITKARIMGEQIRKENGVATAIETLYRELDRARSFIPAAGSGGLEHDAEQGQEEDWTLVEDENPHTAIEDAARNWEQLEVVAKREKEDDMANSGILPIREKGKNAV